jgi:hypothetical protein
MRDDEECRCYVDHLVAEHRRLHAMLREMRVAIVSSIEPDGEPSFTIIARILARLRGELEHHFSEEEKGGCLDEALSRCPRSSAEARQIEAEHPEILAEIDRLLEQTTNLQLNHQNQLTTQNAFDHLYRRLCAHEAAENPLLAQGFGTGVNGNENGRPTLIYDV